MMIRGRHIRRGNLLRIDGKCDMQDELVKEVLRQLTPVRPADPFLVHLVLGAGTFAHFLFQHGQRPRTDTSLIGLPDRNCSVLIALQFMVSSPP